MASISSLGIGSGLDLGGLLDQLASAERQRLQPLTGQKGSYQAKISAFGKLEGSLSQFQVAVDKLNDAKLFTGVKSEVTGSAVTAAAGADATVGNYQLEVTTLARAYSVATNGIADKATELGAGTLTFNFGSGDSLSVDITQAQSSLEGIRDAINAKNAGVSASIVNDGSGSPYRLVLASTETGTDAAIASVDFGNVTGLSLDTGTEVIAQNAQLKVNNIAITSQGNRVEGAIQGVTLDLAETGAASLAVSRDQPSIKEAIKGFVSAYNSLQGSMADLSSFDAATGSAGLLLGDSTLRSVQSKLRATMTDGVAEGQFQMLSDIGISLQLDGKLKLDEGKLDTLLSENMTGLADFFAGGSDDTGLAGRLSQTLGQLLAEDGTLDTATSGLKDGIERVDLRYQRLESSIEATIARYRDQFAKMDSLVANMNSTSSYLTQQFEMMNAQLKQ
ncbi:flagellar filament capping protein FliD [Zobellella maritima]|uniref:flagellar filament capping protein FliD n=1 Tax=Zobellella maritima TaxID=2059725 RepID=UPI000E303893|nr:flagellar filament capping protein FliD [Zobellella maritima]